MVENLPLIFSLLVLVAVPFIFKAASMKSWLLSAMDGFVIVSVFGLVLVEIVPCSIEDSGLWAIAACVLGFFAPLWGERIRKRFAEQAHFGALVFAIVGLLLHAFVDGIALLHDKPLGVAVIVHRLPMCLTIWVLIKPKYGTFKAAMVLALVGVLTVLGHTAGDAILSGVNPMWMGIFQSIVAGSLLHVIVHYTGSEIPMQTGRFDRLASGIAGLLGLAALFGVHDLLDSHHSHSHGSEFTEMLWTLCVESAPALVLAYWAAGLVHAFLPVASIRWMGVGGALSQATKGMAFGLPLPICSCGVIPVYRGLVKRGAPASAAMAFLIATPELGFDAVLLSIPLLGMHMTVTRVLAAALVAFIVGALVGCWAQRYVQVEAEPQAERPPGVWAKLRLSWNVGFKEIVDHTSPWIVLGVVIAALAGSYLQVGWLEQIPAGLEVPLFALLGMPTYVCASGATPLIAVLVAKGVSPGAAIAFLLTGPATNIITFGVLSQLHSIRIAIAFGAVMAVTSIALGYLINLIPMPINELSIVHHHEGFFAALGAAAAWVLVAIIVASILRQGVRTYLAQLFNWDKNDNDHHCHNQDHDHTTSVGHS